VWFPAHILQRQGGFHTLEVTVSHAAANPADRMEIPPQARVAPVPTPFVEAQPIAEGVWFLAGGSHNSVAAELRDYVAVIEAPQSEERSLAVIAKVKELVPDKAIRYLINTHHHFDHSGGMRTYAAEGAAIITHEINRRFYDLVFAGERRLRPDRLSYRALQPRTVTVADRHVLRNGSRAVEIHHVADNLHDGGLLMVYFPAERLLVEADAFTPGPPNAPPPAEPSPFAMNLYENVVRLKLDVAQLAPLHGRVVPWSEFLRAIGKLNQPPPAGVLRAKSGLPP
jgi:glyoxylase-like metal-dependent hydrolase (beta-lactamase superfamily II)